MNAIQSIFSLPETGTPKTHRVSFTNEKGEFHYRGYNYAYVIRPSVDGAVATLRIKSALLYKFRMVCCFRDVCKSKLPDMEIMQTGPGWYKVVSMSETGDTSVHRFFYFLNRWMLSQHSQHETEPSNSTFVTQRRRYTLQVTEVHHRLRVLEAQPPKSSAEPIQTLKVGPRVVSEAKLQQLAMTINARYGHTVH